jgi:hypothetical protein
MSSSASNGNKGKAAPNDITIRLHLPGFGRTEDYTIKNLRSLDEGKGLNYGIQKSITNHFKLNRNRSCLLIFKDNHYQMLWDSPRVKIEENDTLMLCTRNSDTEGADNTYYIKQNDVLINNKCLEPPLSSDDAIDILRFIENSFESLGIKHLIAYIQSDKYKKWSALVKENYEISPRPKCSDQHVTVVERARRLQHRLFGSHVGGKAITRKKRGDKRITRRNKRKNSK